MKSSPESLALFCKFFRDADEEAEWRYINHIRRGLATVDSIRLTMRCDIATFNNGRPNNRNKIINPDIKKFHIFEEDINDMVISYYNSIVGKNGT